MAVTGNLHKIAFGGPLSGSEEWSCGFHFLSPDSVNINSTLLNDAVSQWFLRLSSSLQAGAKLTYLKANQINPVTGLYVNPANPNTFFYSPELSAPAGNGYGPPHMTLAVSTFTALARGRASKGRFYPPTNLAFGFNGLGKVGSTASIATSAAQLLTDINGAASGSAVVFSKVGQSTSEILGVKVGDVMDVQQRRRRNLVEVYSQALIS